MCYVERVSLQIAKNATCDVKGTFAVGGLTCRVMSYSYSGAIQFEMLSSRHIFVCGLDRDHGAIDCSLDGKRYDARGAYGQNSLLLPSGQHCVGKLGGGAVSRYLFCELEHSAFALVLGEKIGDFDLRPHVGPSPIAPGLLERLESLCLTPNDFPRVYADLLASMLVVELFQASATKPIPPELSAKAGTARFNVVLDFIEHHVCHNIRLGELASLVGLSVDHFSHAFKESYGVSPYRYLLQRRIKRAHTLLQTTDDTIATIAASVGFSSQSRFSQTFASLIGASPSACRSNLEL